MTGKDTTENKLVAERRRKLDELREQGYGYPNEYRRTALAGQLHQVFDEYSNETLEEDAVEVQVGGRIMTKRVIAGLIFVSWAVPLLFVGLGIAIFDHEAEEILCITARRCRSWGG